MKRFLINAILFWVSVSVSAWDDNARHYYYNTNIDGIYYELNSSNNTACVSYMCHEVIQQEAARGGIEEFHLYKSDYSEDVMIPSEVTYEIITYNVTSIGYYAFSHCSDMTSIVIPNSVTSIGNNAFSACSGLTSVTIPNGVTTIGESAFSYCSGLTYITIPNSVTKIGESAFACSGLTSITIPNSVTKIGESAFYGCSGLTSAIISNRLETIDEKTFSGCDGLISIIIPNSVTFIEYNAFTNCSGLNLIKVESDNPNYDSRNNCNAIIDSNNQLILGCKNTIIPNSVTSIGRYAFYGCNGLTSITIPSNVKSIGYGTFRNCHGLVYISLPSKLESIDNYAYFGCDGLTDIYCYSETVPSAYENSFYNPENIILHVPEESIEAYRTTEPWDKFKDYVPLTKSDIEATERCSKPTITLVDGKITLNCETPGVTYHWKMSSPSGTSGSSSTIQPITLNVYATKSGYKNSDVTTYKFPGINGDVNSDGKVNVADHVKLSEIIMNQ